MIDVIGMWNRVVGWVKHPVDAWNRLIDFVSPPPEWMRGPYRTSATHALFTVLGLMAPLPKIGPVPLGPLGMVLFFFTGIPWLWLAASTMTAGWYWRREYRQTGLRPKPKFLNGEKLTFGQRFDTWMDAIFPTVALILQWIWLL